MKKRFGIWLLALAVFLPACQKKDNPEGAGKDLNYHLRFHRPWAAHRLLPVI